MVAPLSIGPASLEAEIPAGSISGFLIKPITNAAAAMTAAAHRMMRGIDELLANGAGMPCFPVEFAGCSLAKRDQDDRVVMETAPETASGPGLWRVTLGLYFGGWELCRSRCGSQ